MRLGMVEHTEPTSTYFQRVIDLTWTASRNTLVACCGACAACWPARRNTVHWVAWWKAVALCFNLTGA